MSRLASDGVTPVAAVGIPRSTAARWFTEGLAVRGGLVLLGAALLVFLTLPLAMLFVRSVEDKAGGFVGLANFSAYFSSGAFALSVRHTLAFAVLTTLVTVPLAFAFAFAIQRTCVPLKALWRNIALIPILAPSMLAALSLIYLFGNQGWLKSWLAPFGLETIYGLPGMVMAMVFASFPHAVMISLAGLSLSDARLYEAADALATPRWRQFLTITLPGARYGIVSAAMVVFTMAVSEFGVPKVIGGNYNVLAIDIYKQVIGQQNFNVGAVVGLLLLVPALAAFAVDWAVRRRQSSLLSARSVPYAPRPTRGRDAAALGFVLLMSGFLLLVLGMAVFGSFVKVWPYNLTLTLNHYTYGFEEYAVETAYRNSLTMAAWCAMFGAATVFAGAYWLEKTRGANALRAPIRLQAMMPMAVPGMVLGIGYILFFNHPDNPLGFLYGTLTILVISTIVHFYSSSHLAAVTALKQLDDEFESVSASLQVPFYRTFWRVTVPVCLPTLIDVGRYYFVNAMTTISAVVFLYSPKTNLASISIIHLDEAGAIGSAAAMATLIVAASAVITMLSFVIERWLLLRTQGWRTLSR